MTELHPEICPSCGRDGYQVMLCFTCDHCPKHCKCDEQPKCICGTIYQGQHGKPCPIHD